MAQKILKGVVTRYPTLEVFDENSIKIRSFQAHSGKIYRMKLLLNGYVATASSDNKVKIWDPSNNWNSIITYGGHESDVRALESIDFEKVASGSNDLTFKIWNLGSAVTLKTINVTVKVFSMQLLKNGSQMAVGLTNEDIRIYDINTGSLIAILSGHKGDIQDFALIGNDLLASASADNHVRIWNLTDNYKNYSLGNHNSDVNGLKMIAVDILASSSSDSTIKLWNTTNGALIKTLSNHTDKIYWSIDFYSDCKTLISGAEDNKINFWDIQTSRVLKEIKTDKSIYSLVVVNQTLMSKYLTSINKLL